MHSNVFEKSDWIWCRDEHGENEYAEFIDTVAYSGGQAVLRISVCGDYMLLVNGKFISSNQYGDFPHYKVYDQLDISEYLHCGENTICILVWYFGAFGMRYNTPSPGVIYEVEFAGQVLACSGAHTLSRQSRAYKSGDNKRISPQLGYSFSYDSTKEDAWTYGAGDGFAASSVMKCGREFYKRPIKRLSIGNLRKGEVSKTPESYIADLDEEMVGLFAISFKSPCVQSVNIAYGEVLENGHVKRIIGERDFSFDYIAVAGENEYTNYMFRCACRYLEITCQEPIEIEYVGILPQFYPVEDKKITLTNALDRRIYDICVNTLKLCMMEHYVDCPWREQCMYAFDSRNQMLTGYYAFADGNFDYARANLLLMSKDMRDDNLLSICFPSASDLTIPCFSLYYILAVKEYVEHSGDAGLANQVFHKLESILHAFFANMQDGLVCKFRGANHWNFYDWSPYAEGALGEDEEGSDFLLNCILVIALSAFDDICQRLNRENLFSGMVEKISEILRERYYNADEGVFFVSSISEKPTELANSLAVISGVAQGAVAQKICDKLCASSLIPCSLSMKTFKYDALLKIDSQRYKQAVLDDIRNSYKIMLDSGSTTVWETAEGAQAFDNAGSLCHGWSAIPIYYYSKFNA